MTTTLDTGRTYRGFPVPYTVPWLDGAVKPDFTSIDPEKVKRCLDKRLCGICGKGLPIRIAWIGGESFFPMYKSGLGGWFTDPPMHIACAEFSAKMCPFLSQHRVRVETPDGTAPDSPQSRRFIIEGKGLRRHGLLSKPTIVLHSRPIEVQP